jgi:hypothetical protein
MDNIKNTLPKKLQIDTQTWGPRRFALVRLVDAIAQEVYMAMGEEDITPRDAEELLSHLGMAAWYLYMPGSQRRRLMSPTGGRRRYPSYKTPFRRLEDASPPNTHKHRYSPIAGERKLDVEIPICKGTKKSNKNRKGNMSDAHEELTYFISDLDDMDDVDPHDWEERAEAIQDALPVDIAYYSIKN